MDEVRKKEALAEVERMVRRIVQGFNPQKIILFGSYARGNFGADSDHRSPFLRFAMIPGGTGDAITK